MICLLTRSCTECSLVMCFQALAEEVEAGQEKLSKVQKQAEVHSAKISMLEDQ